MLGKEYEAEVLRFLNRTDDIYIVRKNEGGFNTLQGSDTYFTPPKGIDFFLLSNKYYNVALEVKYTTGDRFSFNRVGKLQDKMLSQFSPQFGLSFILLGFNGGEQNRLFEYKKYKEMVDIRQAGGMKSINVKLQRELFNKYSFNCERYGLRTRYYINLFKILHER